MLRLVAAPAVPQKRWTYLREIQLVSERTPEIVIEGSQHAALRRRHISWMGNSDGGSRFHFATRGWQLGQVLVCSAGEGRVCVDGQWLPCRAGTAYLTPPGVPHAYHALPGRRWRLAWVNYEPPFDVTPLSGVERVTIVRTDPTALYLAIRNFNRECLGVAEPNLLDALAEVIHLLTLRAVGVLESDVRLSHVWEAVDARPGEPWSLEALAEIAGLSGEHLRRLCHKQHGRSPMQQVTMLRLRRAGTLLRTSPLKIDAIAGLIGYGDRYSFTAAFKRHLGFTPAEYRKRGRPTAMPPDPDD